MAMAPPGPASKFGPSHDIDAASTTIGTNRLASTLSNMPPIIMSQNNVTSSFGAADQSHSRQSDYHQRISNDQSKGTSLLATRPGDTQVDPAARVTKQPSRNKDISGGIFVQN